MPADYNRKVRISCILALAAALTLAGCHRGDASKDAVRRAVIDYLGAHGMNAAAMNVEVTAVNLDGDRGDASVSFTAKGGPALPGMSFVYLIERRGAKWVVTGRKRSGGATNPHGAMPPAGMANPHGMGAGGAGMPAPQDLPPVDKSRK